MDEESMAYLLFSMLIPMAAFVLLPQLGSGVFSIIAVAIILLGIAAIMVMNWVDFVLFSIVTNLLNITFQPASGYKIVRTQDAVPAQPVHDAQARFRQAVILIGHIFSHMDVETWALP